MAFPIKSLVFPRTGIKTDGSTSSQLPTSDFPFLPNLLAVTDQMAKHHSFYCPCSFLSLFMFKEQLLWQNKLPSHELSSLHPALAGCW